MAGCDHLVRKPCGENWRDRTPGTLPAGLIRITMRIINTYRGLSAAHCSKHFIYLVGITGKKKAARSMKGVL